MSQKDAQSSPIKNLWQAALDSLDSKLQSHLTSIASAEYGDIVTSILRQAEKKKSLCLQKRWRIKLRGKTIVLRDIIDKIITWVSQFRAIVDVAAQYDPTAVVNAFLHEHTMNPLSAPVAYFYCGDSRFGRAWADPDEVMRSLTRQFAVVDRKKMKVHEQVFLEYSRREAEARIDGFETSRLRAGECTQLMLDLIRANPAVIIVDGVDEVEENRRHELLNALIKVRDESASVVKIFLSSRDNSNIFAGVPDASMIRVQEVDTRSDMEVYVRHCVSSAIDTRRLLNGCVSGDLREELISFLLERAGEMFLWVKLQTERLTKFRSAKSIWEVLKSPSHENSSTVGYLYADTLEKLQNEDPVAYTTAIRVFSWLLCMYEPLSTAACVDAIAAVETSRQKSNLPEILTVCSNLIVVDSQLDTLRFAHVSFKEFLESKEEFAFANTHFVAASSCLNTVMEDLPLDDQGSLHPDRDYTLYAALYWARHYTASSAALAEPLVSKLKEFAFDDGRETGYMFELWLEAVHHVSQRLPKTHPQQKYLDAVWSESLTPFFVACVYGLEGIFYEIAEASGFDINMTNSAGHTGLYLAAACGHDGIVRLLLNFGARTNVRGGNFGNPLSAACAAGHIPVIRMLLGDQFLASTKALEAALHTAFLAGHEETVRTLLEYYLRAMEQAEKPDPATFEWLLEGVASNGFTEVFEDLTKTSPSLTKATVSPKTINGTVRKGHIPLVKRFMNRKALPADIVATAALFGQSEIISLCLDGGFDIEHEGPFGTPLRAASLMGHDSCVRLLLSRGADVNAVTPCGDALQAAAMKGHLLITNTLIQSGANVNNSGGFFGNALQAAAYRGHREIAQVLLKAGAAIYTEGRYNDAFYAAAAAGNADIIKTFIGNGYYVCPERGSRMLRHLMMVTYRDLLREASPDRGRDTQRRHKTERPFIDEGPPSAAICDFADVLGTVEGTMRPPIEHPPAIDYKTWAGGHFCDEEKRCEFYALEVAASRGHEEIIQTAISNRKWSCVGASHYGQALWAASTHGYIRVVEILLSAELDLSSFIRGALECAGRYGHVEVIDTLIEYAQLRGSSSDDSYQAHVFQRELEEVFGTYKSPCVLPLVLSGCRGDRLPTVLHGFEVAQPEEIGKLCDVVVKEAAKFNSTGTLEYFLHDRVFLNPWQLIQAMRTASTHGSQSALELLIRMDRTMFASWYGLNDVFADAVRNSQAEIVRYLVGRAFNRPSSQLLGEALLYAALNNDFAILKLIAPVMEGHKSYQPALDRALTGACAAGLVEAAEFLVKRGANTNAIVDTPSLPWPGDPSNGVQTVLRSCRCLARLRCPAGCPNKRQLVTPLQACLEAPTRDIERTAQPESVVNLLIRHGADVNGISADGTPLFHIAVRTCTPETVRNFITHGVELNSKASDKSTCLDAAVSSEVETLPVVCMLLEAGVAIPIQLDGKHPRCSIIDSLLDFFASHPWSDMICSLFGPKEVGRFRNSRSIEQVLSTGPGAVIKELLLHEPELRTTDTRYGLLLQMLAVTGDCSFLKLLIERGVDVNLSGYYYGSAIQAAARYGRLEYARLLLRAGSQVKLLGGVYGTALHASIIAQHQEIVDLLISHGADVNSFQQTAEKESARAPPLQLAIKSDNQIITRSLLLAGADVHIKPCPLQLAAETGSLELTEMLLDFGAQVNSRSDDKELPQPQAEVLNTSALHAACSKGHYEITRLLLERGAYPQKRDKEYRTPLAIAAWGGHIRIMKLLLESGAQIYQPGRVTNVLTEALKGKARRQSVQFLVERLAGCAELGPACRSILLEDDWQGDEGLLLWVLDKVPSELGPLSLACRFGFKDAVKIMLPRYNNPDCDLEHGARALHVAAYYQEAVLVSFLIEQGTEACFVSPKYGSPISAALGGLLASGLDHKPISRKRCARSQCPCDIVFEEGGKAWMKFYQGVVYDDELLGSHFFCERCLDSASSFHDSIRQSTCERIIRKLLSAGAKVNTQDRPLGPPLHVASYIGSLSIVELLLQQGADINESGGFFGTALIAAACGEQQGVLNLLLARGINVNFGSERHKTALHCARRYMDSTAVRALVEHGAVE